MSTMTIPSDVFVDGNLYAKTQTYPAGSVTNASVQALAGISASKLQHKRYPFYSTAYGSAVATIRIPIYRCNGTTATINSFKCLTEVLNIGAATISIQVKKNGSNILSAATVLDTGNTAFIAESAAGFTSTALVAGDVLEVDITATAGGGTLGQGLLCVFDIDEDAQ